MSSRVMQKVYVEGLPPGPQVNRMIAREKAGAFGGTFDDINNTSRPISARKLHQRFPNRGRMQRVIVQPTAGSRMNAAPS